MDSRWKTDDPPASETVAAGLQRTEVMHSTNIQSPKTSTCPAPPLAQNNDDVDLMLIGIGAWAVAVPGDRVQQEIDIESHDRDRVGDQRDALVDGHFLNDRHDCADLSTLIIRHGNIL